MITRLSSGKMRKNIFWDSFFFALGFNSNPLLHKVKEIAAKSVDQRISESWGRTSETFEETFEKQERVING
jgi:hypothetical protein